MKNLTQKPPAKADLCPCCGHHDLKHAWDHIAGCHACAFFTGEKVDLEQYRHQWITEGMLWRNISPAQPKKWDPQQNLARLALVTTLSRVHGRPPRMAP